MTEPIAQRRLKELLDALGEKCPAPGGGAAAGMAGAAASATARMVVSYSVGRKSLAEHAEFLRDASGRLHRAQAVFLALADEDAEGYANLNRLMKLDENDPERTQAWEAAVDAALAPPRAMLAAAGDLLRLCESMCGRISPHLRSDLAIAAVLAEGAARSAAWNVSVNLPLLTEDRRHSLRAEAELQAADAKTRAARVEALCTPAVP